MLINERKLNECPFCGSKHTAIDLVVGMKWVAGCNNCGCRTGEYSHELDAVNAWNKRAGNGSGIDEDKIRRIVKEMMTRGYPDDDCDENHMSMPVPVEEIPGANEPKHVGEILRDMGLTPPETPEETPF